MIYLDNGATTNPKPMQVRNAMNRSMQNLSANPGRSGHAPAMRAAEAIFRARETAADFFEAAGPEDVVFTMNCTQSINFALKGTLKPGDHVVISCLEHNALWRPIWSLSKRGISYSVAKVFPGDDAKTLKSFQSCMKPNTRMIACTHASNVWGIRLPVEQLAELAHERGALFLLDAAQSAGVLPISMKNTSIDFLCCAGHKGLYGPMGTGILILSPGTELVCDSVTEGGTGSGSASPEQPAFLPDHLESGTANVPGIVALGEGIRFVRQKGRENLFRHEMRLIRELYRQMEKTEGIHLYTQEPTEEFFAPVLSFNLEGLTAEETAARLNDRGIAVRGGLHCAPLAHDWAGTLPEGAVRCVPSAFTREEETEQFFRELLFIKNNR